MNHKKMAIIAALLVIIIASAGASYAFNLFGGPTTDFDNQFMSGTFTGEVTKNKIDKNLSFAEWTDSYTDKERNITYNMSCIKGGSFLTDMYQLQGMAAPEVRNFNNVPWSIFYSQAVPTNDANDSANSSAIDNSSIIHVYICQANVDGVSYMINIIAYDNESIKCDGTLYCDYFKNDIQPLLESITLKDAKKAPQMYKVLNMSKEDFNSLQDYIEQVKAGNVTAQ